MWCVIGSDGTDATIRQSLSKRFPIGFRLDGGIAFDARAQLLVILIRKKKMRHTSLRGYLIILGREELQFFRRRNMCYMKSGTLFSGKTNRKGCALIASLMVADNRMETDIRIVAILLFDLRHIGIDAGCILAMAHDECWRRTEYLPERRFFIHKHTARTATHKELNARRLRGVEPLYLCQVIVRGSQIETIIHMASMLGKSITFLQKLKRGGLRHDIRHIENSCHTTSGSSPRLAFHRGFMREARLSHVNMTVNNARKQVVSIFAPFLGECFYLLNASILNDDRCLIALTFIDYSCVLYDDSAACHSFP